MPKSLVLGNGTVLATFGANLLLNDFYYPYVGLEDHTTYLNYHRIGVWVDGDFSWLDLGEWDISIDYKENSLVSDSYAHNTRLHITLHFEDFVYTTRNVFFRRIHVTNASDQKREIRIFFHHDFFIYGAKFEDTAEFEPSLRGVLHYSRNRYFLINGNWADGKGMDQYSIGKSHFGDLEGTFRDAEDGELSGNAVAQGSVDSTVRFSDTFSPQKTKLLHVWVTAAKCYEETQQINDRIYELTPDSIYQHTKSYWSKWLHEENRDFTCLPEELRILFNKSLLIMRTQIDNNGAIIASTDNDIQKFNKDTYAYCWPRDGAFVAMALCEAGYEDPAQKFFLFCRDVVTKEGYAFLKYHPDKSMGSSWHPKIKDGEVQIPIQEDESALILVALRKYYDCFQTTEVIQSLFDPLILKIGRWMLTYRDAKTGLPLPSYDLWEEHREVHSFTTATVIAGLRAAGHLSDITGHLHAAETFNEAAEDMKKAFLKYLYSEENKRFLKNITLKDGVILHKNNVVDISLSHIWSLGVLPADDERIKNTMNAIKEHLSVPGAIGGMSRFTNDYYHFDFDTLNPDDFPGNPWLIATLWFADYNIEIAKTKKELKKSLAYLQWAADRANKAGLLPEQCHPVTGVPLSVSPLTWSHATYVSSIYRYVKKYHSLQK